MDWMWFMILLGEVWLVTKVRYPKALVLKSELSHSYLLLNNWLDNLMWLSHYSDDACTLLFLAFLCYTSDYFMLDSAFFEWNGQWTIRRLSSHAGRLWFKLMGSFSFSMNHNMWLNFYVSCCLGIVFSLWLRNFSPFDLLSGLSINVIYIYIYISSIFDHFHCILGLLLHCFSLC